MTPVHQLLPAAAPRDAITGQAFAWRDLLRTWGCESEIVAEHVHPELIGTVQTLDRAGKRLVDAGAVILRYALWSSTAEVALRADGPGRSATTTSRPETCSATSTRTSPSSATAAERPWPAFEEKPRC